MKVSEQLAKRKAAKEKRINALYDSEKRFTKRLANLQSTANSHLLRSTYAVNYRIESFALDGDNTLIVVNR